MLTIAIELNHVVRNVNKQFLKYYQKDIDEALDIDEIDIHEDVLEKYLHFPSKKAKSDFIYIDYPYEIFGCAPTMEKELAVKITMWLEEIGNIEDEDIRLIFYSLHEDNLTIQSSYFFLSRIGARIRKVVFPKDAKDIWDECDAIITASNEMFENGIPEGKKAVLINRLFNQQYKDVADLAYDNLSDIIDDKDFFNKLKG